MELAITVGLAISVLLIFLGIAMQVYDRIRKGRVEDDIYQEVYHLINIARYDNNPAERAVAANRISTTHTYLKMKFIFR